MTGARRLAAAIPLAAFAAGGAVAQEAASQAQGEAESYEQDGKWLLTADDTPTFHVAEDGTVDWYTFSGYRRYHSECHVCHGPDGQGSTYAPALAKSVEAMDYYTFLDVVVNGKQEGNLVMPSFGTNKNVMCYLDDVYVYLKAMGSEAIPRGRPAKKADKPQAFTDAEQACMG